MSGTTVKIATRRSRLALWQAEHVKARLEARHPGLRVELVPMTTRGDEILDVTLSKIGGKGLFVKELELAMLEGAADLAVHSMKDVPAELPGGFTLAATLEREDPRDALVSGTCESLSELPAGAVVGTSSLRRQAQVAERHPTLQIQPLRGNVETRLAKLDRGDFSAIILAASGLLRLGLGDRIRRSLSFEESLPAAGQGALAIECREDRPDILELVAPLRDAATEACVRAERRVNRELGGSCTVPLGAFAESSGSQLRLRALVASPDGRQVVRAEALGPLSDPDGLGLSVAAELRRGGADGILSALAPVPGRG